MRVSIKFLVCLSLFLIIILSSYKIEAKEKRWKYFATSIGGIKFYYDSKSLINISNSIVRVWKKTIHPENDSIKEMIVLYDIDCSKRMIRILEARTWYNPPKTLDGLTNLYPKPTEWFNIEPETINESFYETVCKKNLEKAREK